MVDVLLIAGAALLVAAAYLAFGLAAGLGVAGLMLLVAAIAWERDAQDSAASPEGPR